MRIKLDENIPVRLIDILNDLGHDVDNVISENIAGYPDDHVWDEAQKAGRFLVTQDLDFSDIRKFAPGTHCGLLLVRLRDPGRDALVRRVTMLFSSESVGDWCGCFIVATEHKLRVRRPK